MPRKKLGGDSVVESLGENFVIVICLRITVYGGGVWAEDAENMYEKAPEDGRSEEERRARCRWASCIQC